MNVKELRNKHKLSQQELSDLSGIPKGRINGWEQQGTNPKAQDLRILEELFKSIENKDSNSISLSGKKEVIAIGKTPYSKLKKSDHEEAYEGWEGIPMYNVPVSASFVAHYHDDGYYQPQFHLRDPRFKDCDFGAIITGDSMHGEIRHSDRVICKELKNMRSIIHGDIYYIVTDELETCKYIHPVVKEVRAGAVRKKDGTYSHNDVIYDEERLLLVPHNSSIPPSEVYKEDITNIYKVKGVLRGY